MALQLYAHPFSSYCWKVLIALWEKDLPFTYRHVEHEGVMEELAAIWPLRKFPVLTDDGRPVIETSVIIEHLDLNHPGPRLIPEDAQAALEVRLMDRMFDLNVMNAAQNPVNEAIRQMRTGDGRVDIARTEAAAPLDAIYGWLEDRLAGRTWAAGENFTLADCAAAPSLFYADWVHPIDERFATLRAYRARLLARPTVSRAVEEARPYRHYFPLGAPDRD